MKIQENELNIREANLSDAKSIQGLLEQLGYRSELEQVNSRIMAFENTKQRIFVAELNNVVKGLLSIGLYEQLWTSGPCCRIDTVIVDEKCRGLGIGKLLFKTAENYAVENKCKLMDLITSNKRKQAGTHTFYESLGFKDHNHLDFSYFCKAF